MTRRSPAQYDFRRLRFDETILTKHFTAPRRGKIKFVVAHHMTIVGTGDGRANDACYRVWQNRQASAHYGVDGKYVRQFVWDGNAAWSTANTTGNHSGISIEHANLTAGPSWKISETTWKTGAALAAYLHVAYGLGRPKSSRGGKSGTLRTHSSFFATACPGPHFATIWDAYVAEAQRVYDGIVKATPTNPKPTPPKPQLARWFTHVHLNTWGDDGAEGTRTLPERIPAMMRDLILDEPEVITLNEVRPSQVPLWAPALRDTGYTIALAKGGNLIAVPAGTKVARVHSYVMPKSVQGAGREEVTGEVRAHINGHWIHIGASHLDYRSEQQLKGADTLRVRQAKVGVIAPLRRFAVRYVLPTWKTRTSIGMDTNSDNWVEEQAFKPAGLPAAVRRGMDAIQCARPTISTDIRDTESDHPIVSATYGKKAA